MPFFLTMQSSSQQWLREPVGEDARASEKFQPGKYKFHASSIKKFFINKNKTLF
jgi:hypothetical protein